jgi:hypothetical protein
VETAPPHIGGEEVLHDAKLGDLFMTPALDRGTDFGLCFSLDRLESVNASQARAFGCEAGAG